MQEVELKTKERETLWNALAAVYAKSLSNIAPRMLDWGGNTVAFTRSVKRAPVMSQGEFADALRNIFKQKNIAAWVTETGRADSNIFAIVKELK